jgi:hypothetical protein
MPLAAASGPLLLAAVYRRLGRVQIEGHLLGRDAAEATVELVAATRDGALDRADMRGPEPARELPRGRRRRRLRDRPELGARLIRADVLEVIEALRADQLRLGDRDRQLARREPPPALLDRHHPSGRGQLRIDQLHQPQAAAHLARDSQPGVPGQRRIISAKLDPSGAPGRVNDDHPLGEASSRCQRF